ncbi:hypothetical protein [Ruminococcus flavefaciens]|uniref:hypothetical protein n=1 Tax=Ruminococcus flavefaciens TaxID=1265 RepID=UPI0026F29C4F|nr:hypothetical protein [Ruminococcus flavefaciens]
MIRSLKNKDNIISLLYILILSALVITGSYFHEPWFDEAQAYLLARDASWHDIIFFWTHYEGHPPLWHMILKCAVSLGLPYELTLKGVNFIFFEAVLILIEFRSPFSRITKTIIPLSYFILYQYSVTSRPYILIMLAVLMTAMFYKERNNKPIRYCLSLMFLCALHSYGIAFAGGIVIADLLSETLRGHSIKKVAVRILRNKRLLVFYTLLLAFAVFLIIDIMPRSDTSASEKIKNSTNSYFLCLLLCFFLIPSETLITSYSSDIMMLQNEKNPLYENLTAGLFSLIIWSCIFVICRKRKMLPEMIIPYFFISILASLYINPHHFGIFLAYLLFILWTASDVQPVSLSDFSKITEKAGLSPKTAKKIAAGAAAVFAVINLYWDGYAYYTDITHQFDPGKSLAQWIKNENLTGKKILAEWDAGNTHMIFDCCITSSPYFEEKQYYEPYDELTFISHIVPSESQSQAEIEMLAAKGKPDFIVCAKPYSAVRICDELHIAEKYNAVAFTETSLKVFKSKAESMEVYIMCTNETFRELYGRDYKGQIFEK